MNTSFGIGTKINNPITNLSNNKVNKQYSYYPNQAALDADVKMYAAKSNNKEAEKIACYKHVELFEYELDLKIAQKSPLVIFNSYVRKYEKKLETNLKEIVNIEKSTNQNDTDITKKSKKEQLENLSLANKKLQKNIEWNKLQIKKLSLKGEERDWTHAKLIDRINDRIKFLKSKK